MLLKGGVATPSTPPLDPPLNSNTDDQRLEPFLYFTADRNGSNSCVY